MSGSLINLTDVNGIDPPANSWTWVAQVTVPGITNSANPNDYIDKVYCLDVVLPFNTIGVMSRYRGGSHLQFPSDVNNDVCNITFYESENWKILQKILGWQQLIYSPNNAASKRGNYNVPSKYFSQITVQHFDGTGKLQLEVDLQGCWPSAINSIPLNYSNSTNITLSVTFIVNNIVFKFGNSLTIGGVSSAFSDNNSNSVTSTNSTLGQNSLPTGDNVDTGATQTFDANSGSDTRLNTPSFSGNSNIPVPSGDAVAIPVVTGTGL